MLEGGYDGYSVNSSFGMRNDTITQQEKRLSVAFIAATTPEAYETISKNNVGLFHGTNSNALASILKYGLKMKININKC